MSSSPVPVLVRLEIRAAIAPLHAEPRVASPQISQRLAGQIVDVLETSGDWLRVQGDDGYQGWLHRGYTDPLTGREAMGLRGARVSLGCTVYGRSGNRRALPLGARLAADEELDAGEAVAASELSTLFPRTARAIANTALERFAGAPYQWGGITPWGADCSGLVQTTFMLHGINLPRDAHQQAGLGDDAGADLRSLRTGDLLFFSDRPDGPITHVAIALGDARLVHCSLGRGGHAVERLDDERDEYVIGLREKFRFGRRVSLG